MNAFFQPEQARYVVSGASYIGAPKSNTVLYITKKIEFMKQQLQAVEQCLVFADKEIDFSEDLTQRHQILLTDNPQLDYANFVSYLANARFEREKQLRMLFNVEGYWISETATIGKDVYIEPGCYIGHHVVIGDNAVIRCGSVIKNSVIGNGFILNENSVVGAQGFTMAKDKNENLIRIPSLGRVIIGDEVEIGACNNISCGSAGDTIIGNHVKTDSLVHIGHDAHLEDNVEIVTGSVVGGFSIVKKGSFLGINASIKNRITLGCDCVIGMGAVVIKSIDSNTVVVGNPAKPHLRRAK